MATARRHQRLLATLAFAVLVVAASVAGRWTTSHLDRLLHVGDPVSASARSTPFLLAGVKVGAALLLARLAWRFARAHTAARAGRRLLTALGRSCAPAPRVRVALSPRLWALAFASTAAIYLVEADVEHGAASLAPWLHTYALPVFAVLAVVVAVGWSVVSRWLAAYESYAEETIRRARRLAAAAPPPRPRPRDLVPPRRLHGHAFESRPPPVPA